MSVLKKLGFLSAFILPLGVLKGYYLGGLWTFSTVAFVFGLFPCWTGWWVMTRAIPAWMRKLR